MKVQNVSNVERNKQLRKILIGAQIVKLDNEKMVLNKDGRTITLKFKTDDGDIGGFACITSKLFYDAENTKINPIITKVEFRTKTGGDDNYWQSLKITLLGEEVNLAEIRATAGGLSDWTYCSIATVECEEMNINFELASW